MADVNDDDDAAIFAEVTLTNGLVTDGSEVTVEGQTVSLLGRTAQGRAVAPARISETLTDMGYRTLEILPAGSTSVLVRVRRN